jgi:hypothetical protein
VLRLSQSEMFFILERSLDDIFGDTDNMSSSSLRDVMLNTNDVCTVLYVDHVFLLQKQRYHIVISCSAGILSTYALQACEVSETFQII